MQLRGTKPAHSYWQFYAMAIIIRPVLRQSPHDQEHFTVFLPKAIEEMEKSRATVIMALPNGLPLTKRPSVF